jgi:hypothetical protein
MAKYNPYYEPEKLGLEVRSLDELDLEYEFNIMLIARPKGKVGQVYVAFDSGCSCPIPFEDYAGETQEEVLALMERVRNWDHLSELYKSWARPIDGAQFAPLPPELKEWFQE